MHTRIPHPRFLAFLAILIAGFVAGTLAHLPLRIAFVAAFDVAALSFIAGTLPLWRIEADLRELRARSERDDGGRVFLLLLAGVIAMAVLVCVVDLLGTHRRIIPGAKPLAIATEAIAWGFANLVYAFHYARLYYDRAEGGGDHGGIALPGGAEPGFADFASFALVIGMTCQTADIEITGPRIRRASTLHALIAFFFNLGVLAITVNIVAGAL
ncbi:hypothetical protein COC42_07185 [Sphingomonas spermidinifaciens]|uniref:DUF1345 domain-containing protein n=1 Tax=Sphingomonas spermidinifaciens TaxID=1141889 RepID=A0A2A4B6J7_9SPHN|nr:DUF1345 domain-containing protein [Sphingomonas spermidinifaciens]PCD04081.1 hypothetical protein COC42_07185 [Sphingomonas spermidinifaciens]